MACNIISIASHYLEVPSRSLLRRVTEDNSLRRIKVDRYVEPAEFDRWKQVAEDMGFLYVASGPLVRSSYKVRESLGE